MSARKFKVDEWVDYYQFIDCSSDRLREMSTQAVILEVLDKNDIYDYRIFIDDGTSKIRKVKEENLFPHNKTK